MEYPKTHLRLQRNIIYCIHSKKIWIWIENIWLHCIFRMLIVFHMKCIYLIAYWCTTYKNILLIIEKPIKAHSLTQNGDFYRTRAFHNESILHNGHFSPNEFLSDLSFLLLLFPKHCINLDSLNSSYSILGWLNEIRIRIYLSLYLNTLEGLFS